MTALLVLGGFALLWYWVLAPVQTFLQRCARLLDEPRIDFSFVRIFSRDATLTGKYKNRATVVLITRPIEDSLGLVRVSLATSAKAGEPWKNSVLTRQNAEISRATFDLEARYELVLTLEEGWLHATWRPRSEWMFPGRFDETRWKKTLQHMGTLAEWMERSR